jgi:hypothetical protein
MTSLPSKSIAFLRPLAILPFLAVLDVCVVSHWNYINFVIDFHGLEQIRRIVVRLPDASRICCYLHDYPVLYFGMNALVIGFSVVWTVCRYRRFCRFRKEAGNLKWRPWILDQVVFIFGACVCAVVVSVLVLALFNTWVATSYCLTEKLGG